MKNFKRVIALLMTICMCGGLLTIVHAENMLSYTTSFDNTDITESDSDQTVTLTIDATEAFTWYGIGFTVVYDSPLVFTSVDNREMTFTDADPQNTDTVASTTASNGNEQLTNVAIITFTIPAGTAYGTYKVGITALEIVKDFGLETVEEDATVTAEITIEKPKVPATGITVNPASVSVYEGDTATVTATVTPDNTTDTVEWTSKNEGVAKVAGGKTAGTAAGTFTAEITGEKEGSTTVTVTAGNQSATVSVTVTKRPHEHEKGEFVDETPATCTEKGIVAHWTCTGCNECLDGDGKVIADPSIPVLGHDWVAGETVPPTCTEKGYTEYTCTRCPETKQDDFVNKLGHELTWEPIDGNDDEHVEKCTRENCDYSVNKPHSFKQTDLVPATHTEEGSKTLTCTKCGYEKTEIIPTTDQHTYEDWEDNGDGTHIGYCACGDTCTEDHTPDEGEVTLEPTTEAPGEMLYTCTKCGAEWTEEIPAIPEDSGFDSLTAIMMFRRKQEQKRLAELKKKEAEKAAEEAAKTEIPEVPAKTENPFLDVFESDTYYDDVMFVYENGIMNGVGNNLFDPASPLNRAMIVTVLYRMEGSPAVSGTQFFEDVPLGEWYSDAVEWAAAAGIVNGYGDGNFGPKDELTREQLAAILFRYANWKGYDTSVGEDTNILSYDDVFEIGDWAMSAMQWACGAEIYGEGSALRPAEAATRAEIAEAIHAFLTIYGE